MNFSADHLAPLLPRLQQANQVYVGFSGGLDSTVLLHCAARLPVADKLTAIHINHGLSRSVDHWQHHCEDVCRQLGIACVSRSVKVENHGEGLEQAAREARYSVFADILKPTDVLLLGHHADDQAETVLYRLLRGAGPLGLSGIPAERPLGKAVLLRPLLNTRRRDLEDWATAEGLTWIEDESNTDEAFDRNFLRLRVMPVLQGRWGDLAVRLGHTASLCRETDQLNAELAAMDLQQMAERSERLGVSIPCEPLRALSPLRQRNLLRHWFIAHGYRGPARSPLEQVQHELLEARPDAEPLISFGDAELRRFQERVYLMPPLPAPPDPRREIDWDTTRPLEIPGAGLLTAEPGAEVTVSFRRGGERCKPLGREHSQTLKKLFQEYRLEPWLRDRIPLIYRKNRLLAAADLFVCSEEGERLELNWSLKIYRD